MVKRLQVMIQFMAALLFLQMISAGNAYAQDTVSLTLARSGMEGKIAAADAQVPLERVLDNLEKEYKVTFLYQKQVVADKNLNARKVLLTQVTGKKLARILTDLGISYTRLDEETYVLFQERKKVDRQSQPYTVSGTVTDTQSNETLPGVNVVVKGTTTGTATNADGQYSLNVSSLQDTLVFSFIGFQTQEIPIDGRSTIDVAMVYQAVVGEELMVVGYGTVRQQDVTGSIATADLETFRESGNTNIMQSLQGTVAGLHIGQVNQAGQEPSISIRGQTTLDGNTNPLVIVDGVIHRGRIGDLNPSDIKSINILKDASSKAIYGSQASNGVILITTYKGRKSSKPVINYTGSFSSQTPTVNLRPLNREEFLGKVRDIYYEAAFLSPDYTEANPDFGFATHTELFDPLIQGIEEGTNFNWWDAQTQEAYTTAHNLSVSGGSESTTYFLSGGYTDQQGLILHDNFERVTARMNIQTDITDWLTVGTNTFGTFSDFSGNNPRMGSLVSASSPLTTPKDENGEFITNPDGSNRVNPLLNAQADNRDKRNRISGNVFSILEIPGVEGLSYRINYSNDYRWSSVSFSNPYGSGFSGVVFKTYENTWDTSLDNILTYDRQFKDHSFELTLVAGLNKISYDYTRAEGTNVSDQSFSFNSLQQAVNQEISSSAWEELYVYQVGRINYNYKNRYFLTTSLRRDGFSGFSEGNKFGLFPSIGIGWLISEESFFSISQIDLLKLRASYGQTGNTTSRYSSLAIVETLQSSSYIFGDGGSTQIGQTVASMANENLVWERTDEINLGLDFSILNDRVSGSFNFYRSTTKDLLWDLILPNVTGFGQVRSNIGEIKNTGYEFSIRTTPVSNRDFVWNLDINFSRNINEIVELTGESQDLVESGLFIGQSIGTVYDYEVDGIWQIGDDIPDGFAPGTYRVVDQNGDGEISFADRVILGRTEPAFRMGFKNSLDYKSFSLDFFINMIYGGSDGYLGAQSPSVGGTKEIAAHNNWLDFYDYWSPSNPDANYAAVWQPAEIIPPKYASRTFVRLQNVSLSYQFDQALIQKIGAQGLKIYVSGKNLLTMTNWDGIDPETNQGISSAGAFPVMKSYTFGIDISF